jgi:Fe-S oxidoreductase
MKLKRLLVLGKASELSAKQRMDTLACVECGRCTQVCPANLAGRPLDPKTIITKTRDALEEAGSEDIDFWEKQTFSSVELDSCTTCGACMEECPMNIEHVQEIMGLSVTRPLLLEIFQLMQQQPLTILELMETLGVFLKMIDLTGQKEWKFL